MNTVVCHECGKSLGNDFTLAWHRESVHGVFQGTRPPPRPQFRQAGGPAQGPPPRPQFRQAGGPAQGPPPRPRYRWDGGQVPGPPPRPQFRRGRGQVHGPPPRPHFQRGGGQAQEYGGDNDEGDWVVGAVLGVVMIIAIAIIIGVAVTGTS